MDATISDPRAVSSVERAFELQPLPPWWEQVTLRSMVIGAVLGVVFCFVALRIHMTAGIVPGLNMPTSVLGFFFVKTLTDVLRHCGVAARPFTRQENIFLQTCITACINLALTGGFGTYAIAMTTTVHKALSEDAQPIKSDIVDHIPTGKWMAFLLLIGLAGFCSILPFKKIMIVDYRLLFPTGSVTAHLINSFHTPQGAYVARMQVSTLLKSFVGSFSWSFFQWFYTAGKECGFQSFPTFGLELYKHRFYFDFSMTYVGLGMICPYMINFALLFGSIISWGLLFPFLDSKKGQWYDTDSPTSLKGSNGYKVFFGITLILTDGIFNFCTLIVKTMIDFYQKRLEKDSTSKPISTTYISKHPSLNYDDRRRIVMFLNNQIPVFIPVVGYITVATISMFVVPWVFSQIKYYHLAALYVATPVFAFCNAYGSGLTDWSVATTYAKFTIFIIAAWVGKDGGVIASLASCGIIMATVHISSQLMQDIKTGYMTLTSPRAMVVGQIFGTILGSIVNPLIFLSFQRTATTNIPLGSKESPYPVPYAGVYRAIALIGIGGIKELPDHCVEFCIGLFLLTTCIDSLRLVAQLKGWKMQKYIPSVTALALPFFLGSYFAIDMCLGTVLLFIWNKVDMQSAELLSSAVAAGLICGEGLWALPTAILSIFNVQPPICMKFLPSGKEVDMVDSFLNSLGTQPHT